MRPAPCPFRRVERRTFSRAVTAMMECARRPRAYSHNLSETTRLGASSFDPCKLLKRATLRIEQQFAGTGLPEYDELCGVLSTAHDLRERHFRTG